MLSMSFLLLVGVCAASGHTKVGDPVVSNVEEELEVTERLIQLYERRRALLAQLHHGNSVPTKQSRAASQVVEEVTINVDGELSGSITSQQLQDADGTSGGNRSPQPAPIGEIDEYIVRSAEIQSNYSGTSTLIELLPISFRINGTYARTAERNSRLEAEPRNLVLAIWADGAVAMISPDGAVPLRTPDGLPLKTLCRNAQQEDTGCVVTAAAFGDAPYPVLAVAFQNGSVVVLDFLLMGSAGLLSASRLWLPSFEGAPDTGAYASFSCVAHLPELDVDTVAALLVYTAGNSASSSGLLVATSNGAVHGYDNACEFKTTVLTGGKHQLKTVFIQKSSAAAIVRHDMVKIVDLGTLSPSLSCDIPHSNDPLVLAATFETPGSHSFWVASEAHALLFDTRDKGKHRCILRRRIPLGNAIVPPVEDSGRVNIAALPARVLVSSPWGLTLLNQSRHGGNLVHQLTWDRAIEFCAQPHRAIIVPPALRRQSIRNSASSRRILEPADDILVLACQQRSFQIFSILYPDSRSGEHEGWEGVLGMLRMPLIAIGIGVILYMQLNTGREGTADQASLWQRCARSAGFGKSRTVWRGQMQASEFYGSEPGDIAATRFSPHEQTIERLMNELNMKRTGSRGVQRGGGESPQSGRGIIGASSSEDEGPPLQGLQKRGRPSGPTTKRSGPARWASTLQQISRSAGLSDEEGSPMRDIHAAKGHAFASNRDEEYFDLPQGMRSNAAPDHGVIDPDMLD